MLVIVLGLTAAAVMVATAWLYLVPTTGDPLDCKTDMLAWTVPGQLLRGAAPTLTGMRCLKAAGVDVLADQRPPAEAGWLYRPMARLVSLDYLNLLGIPDDTAPSPATLRAWLDTVAARLEAGDVVLVHDGAGRGRLGFWDAVYRMTNGGLSPQAAIGGYYVGTELPLDGAKIGCQDGGNGQVQALAEIAQHLGGSPYYPTIDEHDTPWENCPRPAYMDGWDYATISD